MADSAGNTSTATGNFTVDTVAPQVSVEALTGDNRISSAESGELQTLSCTGENGDHTPARQMLGTCQSPPNPCGFRPS